MTRKGMITDWRSASPRSTMKKKLINEANIKTPIIVFFIAEESGGVELFEIITLDSFGL